MVLTTSQQFEYYIKRALALSLALHLILMLLAAKQPALHTALPFSVDVSFEPKLPKQASTQIVSAPESKKDENIPEQPKRFLSSEDTNIIKEQVRRGSPDAATSQAKERVTHADSAPTAHTKRLSTLRLDSKTLSQKFGEEMVQPDSSKNVSSAAASLDQSYHPFSRAAGSGAAILGQFGTNDYLPNLPDGDITLLNAKANQFAVFVSRVATKVFAALRQAGWDRLSAGDVYAIRDLSKVRAIMSQSGELLKVELIDSSGSSRFDEIVISAVRSGVADKNPPKEALLPDGNIHFIFASRSWVRGAIGRQGAPIERRWLLLGTGLE